MKSLFVPMMAFLLVATAYGGSALTLDSAEIEVELPPTGPGPYGAQHLPVPEGWHVWGGDKVHKKCGADYKLVFLNPDLQEDENGILHAQDRFFIQFQAVADEGAEPITRFSFSFGKTHEALDGEPPEDDDGDGDDTYELVNCNDNLPDNPLGRGTAGGYLLFYRSDFTADDGFFVPIETLNVPDGTYGAAVHAYTGEFPNYVEVARAWATARVNNCGNSEIPPQPATCSPETIRSNDHTMPWPIVLPGDGAQTNDVNGLTVEVLEDISAGSTPEEKAQAAIDSGAIQVWLNGDPLPLAPWVPPARDRDVVPLNDEEDCPSNVRYLCDKVVYSTGFKWEGPVECDDIIRVVVTDLNGNVASKQIHNCKTFGGQVGSNEAQVDFTVVGSDSKTLQAGNTHQYQMKLKNVGNAEAHVNLLIDYNKTFLNAKWLNVQHDHHAEEGGHPDGETHVMIPAGTTSNLDIEVTTTAETPKGTYEILAGLEYPVAGQNVYEERKLYLNVDSPVENTTNNTTATPKSAPKETPGPGPVLVGAGLIGALALVGIRRRR